MQEQVESVNILSAIANLQSAHEYQELNWEGSLEDYLKLIQDNPRVTRNAFQRIYDMILSHGIEEYVEHKKKITRYRFFRDETHNGRDAVYGIDQSLNHLVDIFKSASRNYGTERRVILLHGPVGSAKSTIVRLLKKGLEEYSHIPEGAMYSFAWTNIANDLEKEVYAMVNDELPCPMREEPLHLIPSGQREKLIEELMRNSRDPKFPIQVEGDLCPACRQMYRELTRRYKGDWFKVMDHVKVRRLVLAEKDRIGIGTFQPKDEKNQDSTELTGDINYRKIAIYGSDSDPRAFNFDGEFNIANRGIIEFIEMLKLDVAFLYDLLGASQEHKIKSKKFAQTDIDEVIVGHTNEPEYRRLENNEFMEALKDRTVRIDVPYITRLRDEIRIYERDFNRRKVRVHIAPHALEMAAMWAVLTRLEEPKKPNLTRLQKLKLYNGKSLPGFTEDNVKELKEEAAREGMMGISPRYVQDKISNALVVHPEESCVNPFMVLNELEEGLKHHSLISQEEQRKQCAQLLGVVKEEYENIVKNEVQRAIAADEEALQRLSSNYLDNVRAYTLKEKVRNKYTGQKEEPDERLMRSIEQKIDIPESRKDDFRREIMNYIGALAIEGKQFDYKSNERLLKALELKLFED